MVSRPSSVKEAALSGKKHRKKSTVHQARDRVENTGDFEVVLSREGKLSARGVPVQTQPSPQKGRITWSGMPSWDRPDSIPSVSSSQSHFDEVITKFATILLLNVLLFGC